MNKQLLLTAVAATALFSASRAIGANSQPLNPPTAAPSAMMSPGAMMSPSAMSSGAMTSDDAMGGGSAMSTGTMTGPDHGMPAGLKGGDGAAYTGAPDLQTSISLVTAGGPVGKFSIVTALGALAGADTAKAEAAKLTKQYGATSFQSFVAVQDFAVNDAVKKALAAGVKFPTPTLKGADLAKADVTDGLIDGTYYEGYQLDHIVTNPIHEAVMDDIDKQFGKAADANYHKIANQAHYDLAQALGVTTVKLAPFH